MPLEPNFRYLDDLDPNNPADSDPVAQGDDHIRGQKSATLGNVSGNAAEVRLLINSGADVVVLANATELINRAPGSGNNVFRLQDSDGVTNRLNIFRNGGAATPVSQLRLQTPGEHFNLEVRDVADSTNLKQIRITPDGVAMGYAGADAAISTAGGVQAFAQAGNVGQVSIETADDQPAEFAARNTEGSIGLRADANGFEGIVADATLGNAEQFMGAKRGGESWIGYAGSQRITATSAGGKVEGAATITGDVILDGGANDNITLANAAGDFVVSNGADVGIKSVDGEGFEGYNAGALVIKAIPHGMRALGVASNPLIELYRDAVERGKLTATASEVRLVSVGDLSLLRSTNETAISANATQTALRTGGTVRVAALATANGNSFGQVNDEDDVARPIGYNVMPTLTISGSGTIHELTNAECGKKIRLNAVNQVLKVMDGLVGDHTCTVWNDSSGDCTIEEGVGITLSRFTGAGKVSGDYTIPSGARVTLSRRGTSTTWFIG